MEGDSPSALAHQFTTRHGLNARLESLLAMQIRSKVEEVIAEKLQQINEVEDDQNNQFTDYQNLINPYDDQDFQ